MKRLFIAAAAALLLAGPALAQECTEEIANAKSEELFKLLDADPSKGENMDRWVEEVEAEYGGREPTPAETCEALEKLIAKVEAGN
ncbi:MAG: hypothetical protein AAF409_20700 [Pseudomonadota bacterium]